MSICPLSEVTHCTYCRIGLIGKIVTCDLKNPENYLDELVIITTYIFLRCRTIIHQKIREFSV